MPNTILNPLFEHMYKWPNLYLNQATEVLVQILQSFDTVYICIDALDECPDEDRRGVINTLQGLAKSTRSSPTHASLIKLFVTGRTTLESNFNASSEIEPSMLLSVTFEANIDDVIRFVSHKIEMDTKLRSLKESKEKIVARITESSGGMLAINEFFIEILCANVLYSGSC